MDKWKGKEIEDWGGQASDEFKQFIKDFKKHITEELKWERLELVKFSPNHYDASGFIFNPATSKYAYFSISDVRYFSNKWYSDILIRTAKDTKDYTGGRNDFVTLGLFAERALDLTS